MHQKDSLLLAQILSRLKEGNHTDEDIQVLKTREQVSPRESTTHLYINNAKVDSHNATVFLQSTKEKFTLRAFDTVIGDHSKALKTRLLNMAPSDPRKTMQLYGELSALELRDISVNTEVSGGITNRALCTVKQVDHFTQRQSAIVWVLFDDPNVRSKTRRCLRHLYKKTMDKSWTPIKQVA